MSNPLIHCSTFIKPFNFKIFLDGRFQILMYIVDCSNFQKAEPVYEMQWKSGYEIIYSFSPLSLCRLIFLSVSVGNCFLDVGIRLGIKSFFVYLLMHCFSETYEVPSWRAT